MHGLTTLIGAPPHDAAEQDGDHSMPVQSG
jgi:hypothetical protein